MFPGWRERDPCYEQVANAPDSWVDLTPASQVYAAATRAGWAPWQRGQAVPLIWERDFVPGYYCGTGYYPAGGDTIVVTDDGDTSWFVGHGAPEGIVATSSDFYLDVDTGDVYELV